MIPLLLACVSFVAQEPQSRPASAPRSPNLVVIVADDLGYGELGCYGGKEIPTPNIDALARSGVRMTQGYVSCPVCAPTRAGMLTGRYQQRFGLELNPGPAGNAEADYGLPKEEKTIAERLRANGYATGMVGKWHLGYREGSRPTERGFAEFFGFLGGAHAYRIAQANTPNNPILRGTEPAPSGAYLTEAFAREAVEFVARHAKEPFFLYLPFNAVHAPLQAPAKYTQRFEKIADEKRRTFAAMLSALDDAVGNVVAKLDELKLRDDTVIVFFSDNGGPTPSTTSGNGSLRGTKAQVFEGGIRVPFCIAWPGHVPAGKSFDHPVSTLDITPTLLAAARIKTSDELDGKDLVPFLREENKERPHEALFWRFGEQWAVRVGDWKLLKLRAGEPMLFDLAHDPSEAHDLLGEQPHKRKELEERYGSWTKLLIAPRWRRG